MNRIRNFFLLCFLCAPAACLYAVPTADLPVMADAFRDSGKIYIVIAVLLTIFTGIIAHLIYLDYKVSRLEKQHEPE